MFYQKEYPGITTCNTGIYFFKPKNQYHYNQVHYCILQTNPSRSEKRNRENAKNKKKASHPQQKKPIKKQNQTKEKKKPKTRQNKTKTKQKHLLPKH